jgi:NAD(P)-dependent dehydrogenase (short-subunit alcohol dehydrogenase family)
MKDFRGKLAVITGGGTGMGRALAEQLTAEGCHVAICDVSTENMAETKRLCETGAPSGVRVSTHVCDVSEEQQVAAFRDAVTAVHATDHINLLFNNAGIGGGGSFLRDDRAEWERTFGVCWFGVYHCTRAFLPLLVASAEGYLVNTSSVNGFWACLGPETPNTAYSSAKFAVKGFSEALLVDLRLHAPHVKVAVVMPGHIGTSIVINTSAVLGKPDALHMRAEDVAALREQLTRRGVPAAGMTDEHIRGVMHQLALAFRDNAPTTAARAATVILDGVRSEAWRILVGDDAHVLDRLVRESPGTAYERSLVQAMQAEGHLRLLV